MIGTRLTPDNQTWQRAPRETIEQLVAESVDAHPDRILLAAPGRIDLTYADLGRQIESSRRALADAGIGRSHRIGIALPDGPECALALLVCLCSAVCVPLNDALAESDFKQLLAAARVDALIVPAAGESRAARAAQRLGIAVVGLRPLSDAPAGTFELLLPDGQPPGESRPARPDEIALVMHTSGTTGRPKIVPFEHWRLALAVRRQCQVTGVVTTDRQLFAVPFRSMVGVRRGLLVSIAAGAAMICPSAHDGRTLVDLLASMRPTILLGPPVALLAVLDEFAARSPRPRHALKYVQSSFARLSPASMQLLAQGLGTAVILSYGATESGQMTLTPMPPQTTPAGSVGWPYLHEVAIWDDAGSPLPPGRIGEVVVRGPDVFSGYENDDAANRAAFRDGWYRTGDAGYLDDEGFLFLTDRLNDLINRGGNKIAPSDVETVLRQHEGVADAAAFAIAHGTLGQDLAVAIVPRAAAPRDVELRRFARGRLAAFKLPSHYFIVPELPRNALGKVDRIRLRDAFARSRDLAYEAPRAGLETEIAQMFAQTTGAAAVARNVSFFDLGGDSLRGVSLLAQVEAALGVAPGLDALFDHPTVASFTEVLAALLHKQHIRQENFDAAA